MLALVKYRNNEVEAAIRASSESLNLAEDTKDIAATQPIVYAILAMSHLQLGNKEEAAKYRKQLTEVMKLDRYKDDEESLGFVEEVNALFESKAAAESEPATEPEGKDDE